MFGRHSFERINNLLTGESRSFPLFSPLISLALLISKFMAFLWILIFFFFLFNLIYSLQSYDKSSCYSRSMVPGSRYTCNNFNNTCHTFIVYRSQPNFQNISAIANLFGADPDQLIKLNKLTASSQPLEMGRDVLVPINCTCTGEFFQANFSYIVPETMNLPKISCGKFEGLLKSQALLWANPRIFRRVVMAGTSLNVPLKCACPDNNSSNSGVKYLVTYPFIEHDGPTKLSKKFGIPVEELWAENNFKVRPTVYPHTTFLVPLRSSPVIYFNDSDSQTQVPVFVPITRRDSHSIPSSTRKRIRKMCIIVAGVVGVLVSITLLFVFAIKNKIFKLGLKIMKVEASDPAVRSPNSCLSPDLLIGMSTLTYSLYNYKVEELRAATRNFSESTKMGGNVHKGRIGDTEVIVQQTVHEEIRKNIDIFSKINHSNIVKLHGVCYGRSNLCNSYLVFELDGNRTLRDCLLLDRSNVLQWRERVQLAFDIANGIHYLHHCSVPSYIHMNINTKSILVTHDGRGKIANLGAACVVGSIKEEGAMDVSRGGWIAPEYLLEGLISTKVDIFGFGVVLLELISAEETTDGSLFKELLGFLGGSGAEGGCFEKLRSFIDPHLKDDYVTGEALCMAILAKACLEENPNHRPSMNEILKILARIA